MQFICSLITAKKPPILSKSFKLDAGALKKHPGGQLADGEVTRLELSLQDFAAMLKDAKPDQALVYGVSVHERAVIVPQAKLNGRRTDPPTIARDRAHFTWPAGAGVFMCDYDPLPGQTLTREDLLQAIYEAWPELKSAPHIWTTSASSCIYTEAGAELRGIQGQRVYIPVFEAADIPRFGKALYDRLWLAGHGRFLVSASGALLDRCLIDSSVWQPERLDFCGGAQCGPGLKQLRPEPMVFNADAAAIDSRTLPELPPDQAKELEKLKQAARDSLSGEVAEKRAAWIEARLTEALEKIPKARRAAETERLRDVFRRAVESKRLLGDFDLHGKDGKVTVAQILANPNKFHGARFCDPLEPDYGNDDRIAVANLQSNPPYLFSHAHGGTRYLLLKDAEDDTKPNGYTAAELLKMDFPEPVWTVTNILPEGLAILAGKPKLGKSWLTLGLSIAVAAGGYVFGKIPVEQGRVLYLALEDGPRRLKTRIESILCGSPAPDNLHLYPKWPKVDQGGAQLLYDWVRDHPDAKLVVIDTMAKLWPKTKSTGGTLYNSDYEVVSTLKAISDQHNISIILVHHERKAVADDPLEQISGSMGITGSADTILLLQRARGKADATLLCTGRDIEETSLALQFDKQLTTWMLLGDAAEYARSQEQSEILEILKSAGERLSINEIADYTGKRKNAVHNLLTTLCKDGLVKKVSHGKYIFLNVLGVLGENSENGVLGVLPTDAEKVHRKTQSTQQSTQQKQPSNPHEIRQSQESTPSTLDTQTTKKCWDCSNLEDFKCKLGFETPGAQILHNCERFVVKS